MKTPEEWLQSKTHCVNKNVITDRFKEADIAAIQSDAFSAGERKGRIAGLREAGTLARQNGWHGAWHLADNEADRLERSEQATGMEGSR